MFHNGEYVLLGQHRNSWYGPSLDIWRPVADYG